MERRDPVNCYQVHIDTLQFGEKWVKGCVSSKNENKVVGLVGEVFTDCRYHLERSKGHDQGN